MSLVGSSVTGDAKAVSPIATTAIIIMTERFDARSMEAKCIMKFNDCIVVVESC